MRKLTTTLLLLLAMGWLLTGCESDSTAPDDELPPVTAEDVASQSGYLAQAMLEVAPLALEYDGSKADETDGLYTYTFAASDPVQGTVLLYFEQDGSPSGHAAADFARLWTGEDAALTIQPIAGGVPWVLSFTLESAIDQGAGTATVSGSGELLVGDYLATWSVDGYAISDGGQWPAAGTLTFTNEGQTATVTFDGDETATVTVGEDTWTLNLQTGTLTEA